MVNVDWCHDCDNPIGGCTCKLAQVISDEALTTEQLRERIIHILEGFHSDLVMHSMAHPADAILALISSAQGRDGGAVPANIDTWCAAKLRVAARFYLGLANQKDGADYRVTKFTHGETAPFVLTDDDIQAMDASLSQVEPSPSKTERTPGTVCPLNPDACGAGQAIDGDCAHPICPLMKKDG